MNLGVMKYEKKHNINVYYYFKFNSIYGAK